MTFLPGRFYLRTSTAGNIHLLQFDGGYLVTFGLRMTNRTSGTHTVSLLDAKTRIPYGITGSTGPWHLVPLAKEVTVLSRTPVDPLDIATMILDNHSKSLPNRLVETVNEGLPWPLDNRNFGV